MSEVLITKKSADYELLDSGEGRKLERFGDFVVSRPDPQALWSRSLGDAVWQSADATFEQTSGRGKWRKKREFPEDWKVSFEGVTFVLKPSVFKHIGVFPEQLGNWIWLKDKISRCADVAALSSSSADIGSVKVLNLFAYTGGATLFAARAGASVCHIDSSQFAVDCAKANADVSGLSSAPIRFIVDDVKKFVEREIRRGQKYDVIVLDPPVYGKGTKKEVWNLEDDLAPLLARLPHLLSDRPLAVLISGYASGYSDISYLQMLQDSFGNIGSPAFTSGQLAIAQSDSSRLLPAGIFARCEFQNEKINSAFWAPLH
jgi:23S rRNA (cytosine1962-C5)-methyltransferase